MRYLLDTHTAIWALEKNIKLSATAKGIMADTSLQMCVSIISAWEIAIKAGVGKLNFVGGSRFFLEEMRRSGVALIPIMTHHIKMVESLPLLHRDPFDRLLVATAKADGMTILTSDVNIHKYGVRHVW